MHTTTTFLAALTSASLAVANPAPHPALVTPAPMLHPAAARLGVRQFRQPSSSDSDMSKSIECGREYLSLADTIPRETNTDLAKWLLTAASPAAAEVLSATRIESSHTSLCDPSVTATLTPPASLSSAWSTYLESASSWVTSAAPAASSLAQSCGGEISAAIEFLLVTDAETCTKAVLGLVDVVNGDDDATTTGGGSASATRTTSPGETETGSAGDDEEGDSDGGDDSGSGNGGSDEGNDDSNDGNGDSDDAAGAAETSSTSTAGVPRETGMMGVAAAAAVAVAGVVAAL